MGNELSEEHREQLIPLRAPRSTAATLQRGRDRDGETGRDGEMPAGIIAKENLSDECLELGPKCNKLIYNPIEIK